MKLSSQSDALLNLPYVKPDVQTQQLPVPAGLISDPPVGMHPDDQATKAFKYPPGSDHERYKRGTLRKGGFRGQKSGRKSDSKTNQKSDLPIRNNGSAQQASKDLVTLGQLAERDAFPIRSSIGATARESLVGAGVRGLVNIPFTAAEYAVSTAVSERIKAQSEMPGATKRNADGTTGTVNPAATAQQKTAARLEDAEIKLELLANQIISINSGPNAQAVAKSPDASTTDSARLEYIEKTQDAAEKQIQDIAKRYDIIYRPYVALATTEEMTTESRLDAIEKRYASMNKVINTLVVLKQNEAETTD